MRPLNLASQPFRNETLPAVLLVLGGVVLVGLTIQHGLTIRRLLPARTSAAHREAAALEQEAARLRAEARESRVARPAAPVIAQWTLLKELVDRRAFSWTGLFSVLEEVLPTGVRLMSITPKMDKSGVTLELTASAKSYEQGLELIAVLEERPEFADVLPRGRESDADGESRYGYEMRYLPQARSPEVPAAEPPASDGAADEQEARTALSDGSRP